MKNKLIDLNNHLFAQLERLSDESMSQKELEKEVARSKHIVGVSDQIIKISSLQVAGAALIAKHGGYIARHLPSSERLPKQIEDTVEKKS